jgi:hypothetical protein
MEKGLTMRCSPAGASRLQSLRPVRRVAELGSLTSHDQTMTECPKCKSQRVAAGHLAVNGRSTRLVMAFVPGELKWYQFSLEGGAELKTEAFVCSDCGVVWTRVAYPEKLREALRSSGEQK